MHYRQLDGLRFIAAFSVIFHHVCALPPVLHFNLGQMGVNLFFVISGFLITEILLKQKLNNVSAGKILKTFFLRRVLRIFPLYFLYVLLCYWIVPELLSHYFYWIISYTVNFWITIHNELAFWYFTHLWSLAVEEQFYLLWPVALILIKPLRSNILFILLILVAVIIRIITTISIPSFDLFNYTMLPTTLDCFGMGALLAYLKLFKPELLSKALQWKFVILAGLLMISLNNIYGNPVSQQALNKLFQALVAFWLVGISVTYQFSSFFGAMLENKVIVYLGKISYGLYVYHLMVWGELGKYFKEFWIDKCHLSVDAVSFPYALFLFVAVCTTIVSILSFELYEKPILSLKRFTSY